MYNIDYGDIIVSGYIYKISIKIPTAISIIGAIHAEVFQCFNVSE